MIFFFLKPEAMSSLSPRHVAGYLKSQGWKDNGPYGEFGQRYLFEEKDKAAEIVLPKTQRLADFGRRMTEVVAKLAEIEGREASAVVLDLSLSAFDIIRVRSRDADAFGSIRLEEGLGLHQEAKKLVVAAALAEASSQPRKAWKGRRPDSVTEYVDRLRLGQTENASFSLTLLSPYAFEPQTQSSLFSDEAFGRRVTLKFGAALQSVEKALAELSDPLPAFEKAVSNGVSAELCQSLAKLADNDAGIDISVSWSPAKPVSAPFHLNLTRESATTLQEVARAFSQEEPEPDCVLEGFVEEIKEQPERFDGRVTIQAFLRDQPGIRKVRVSFDQEYRNLVYDAAKHKKWVRVVGELVKKGKHLSLSGARDFEAVEPQDEV